MFQKFKPVWLILDMNFHSGYAFSSNVILDQIVFCLKDIVLSKAINWTVTNVM